MHGGISASHLAGGGPERQGLSMQDHPKPAIPDTGRSEADPVPGEPYDVTQQVGHLLRRAYQWHLAIFSEIAADLPLTSVQFVTLCMLERLGDCSQAELIRATAVDQATIRGVVERLTARGFVVQKRDAADRRKVVIGITRGGRRRTGKDVPQGTGDHAGHHREPQPGGARGA